MREYDRRDSGYRPPQRGYRDTRSPYAGGSGYGRSPQGGREYDRTDNRRTYSGSRRDGGYYDDRRAPGYPQGSRPREGMPRYGAAGERSPRYGGYPAERSPRYDTRDGRYRQTQYTRQRSWYDEYDEEYGYDDFGEGGARIGLIIALVMVVIVAAASCIAAVTVNNLFDRVDYAAPTDVPPSAYSVSAADLMARMPDDGMNGEPIAVSDTDAVMSELIAQRCSKKELRSAEGVTNILMIEGKSREDPADIITLISINEEQSLVTFTAIMPETMVAYEGMDAPVRLSCAPLIYGPEAVTDTVRTLYGIKIDGYFFIDEVGLCAVCDDIGTVTVKATDEQVNAVNRTADINEGSGTVIGGAESEMNGAQTVRYVRYAGAPNDHRISERRASVLYYIACNLKGADFGELYDTFKNTAGHCSTNMSRKQLISLGMKYRKLKAYDVITDVAPSDAEYTLVSVGGKTMLKISDAEKSRGRLRKSVFDGAYKK